ncbi:hypothetical protein EU555_28460 [Methylobacterium nonmethylotrophicum]|uniref:Uncharacterized protein n=1 Tax=Methylobacterium nonmethylotrophicum TaxID=1141884 RepID=A0A4Z0NIQ0_9HYPH|nr:hypothetical protein EU555_28460 [Methylobacterium nonmethylotrophicum]
MLFGILYPLIVAACPASPARAQSEGGIHQPAALIHGNDCEMATNVPLPPIDVRDVACARHDACIPGSGLPRRECSLRLRRETGSIARDTRQPEDRRAPAGVVSAGAALRRFDPIAPLAGVSVPASAQYGRPPPSPYGPASYAC